MAECFVSSGHKWHYTFPFVRTYIERRKGGKRVRGSGAGAKRNFFVRKSNNIKEGAKEIIFFHMRKKWRGGGLGGKESYWQL